MASSYFPEQGNEIHFRNISNLTKFIFASRDSDAMYSRLTKGVCAHSEWNLSSIQVLDLEVGKTIPLVRYDRSSCNRDIYIPVGEPLSGGYSKMVRGL